MLNLCTAREVCLIVWPNVTGASHLRVLAPFLCLPPPLIFSLSSPWRTEGETEKGEKKRDESRQWRREVPLRCSDKSIAFFLLFVDFVSFGVLGKIESFVILISSLVSFF